MASDFRTVLLLGKTQSPCEPTIASALAEHFTVLTASASSAMELMASLEQSQPDGVVFWHACDGLSPETVISVCLAQSPRPALLLVSSSADPATVHQWLASGADDVVCGADATRLPFALRHALDRLHLHRELHTLHAQLAQSRQRLANAEHSERSRIAKELHDTTVQELVAVQFHLAQTIEDIEATHPDVVNVLADCAAMVESTANELRSLAYDLHAPWLQHGGLSLGVREHLAAFSQRTGIEIEICCPEDFPRLPAATEMALFRVMQESFTNIRKHSPAKRAQITLDCAMERVTMAIRDFRDDIIDTTQPLQQKTGIGLLSMHERMAAVGGSLGVVREKDGTCVLATVSCSDTV